MVMLQRRVDWPATRSRSRVFAILALLTESTRSPGWKPRLCAGEPLAISTMTTPWAEGSSRSLSASAGRRARRRDARDQRAGGALEPEALGYFGGDGLQPRSEPRTLDDGAAALGRSDHDFHHVRGDRKPDPLRAA